MKVIEQAIQTFKPKNTIPQKAYDSPAAPSRARGRGRGVRGQNNGRGRGGKQLGPSQRDAPAHPSTPSNGEASSLNMTEVKSVLPEVHPVPPPPTEHKLKLQYLLPIELLAILPNSYPIHSAPLVRISSPWLSPNLRRSLLARIEPRKPITASVHT